MEKSKIPLHQAELIGKEVVASLESYCERIIIAGSIRRQKPEVSDIEIVAIPKYIQTNSISHLFPVIQNLLESRIMELLSDNYLSFRVKKDNTIANGPKIKLLYHVASSTPVDIFVTTENSWYNTLVCRTGGKVTNTYIASKAKAKGYHWKMGSFGFQNISTKEMIPVNSEEEVFQFVGIPYLPPTERP